MAYGAILGQQPDKKLNQSILLDESSGILSNVQGNDITNEVLDVLGAATTAYVDSAIGGAISASY